jgi:hypothetical protein
LHTAKSSERSKHPYERATFQGRTDRARSLSGGPRSVIFLPLPL